MSYLNGWIHIKDNVPQKDELILFYDEVACEFNLGVYENGVFLDNGWFPCESVVYWMSLYSPHIT